MSDYVFRNPPKNWRDSPSFRWLKCIKPPYWVNQKERMAYAGIKVGDITWDDKEIKDCYHIELNRYYVNFDVSCFEVIPKQEVSLIGDIGVRIIDAGGFGKEGDFIEATNNDFYGRLKHKTYCDRGGWRLATPEEIELYKKGVKNIYDGIQIDKVKSTQSMEDLLKEAALRFLIGSKYKPLKANGTHVSLPEAITKTFPIIYGGDKISVGYGYVYANGKWAEVIEEKKEIAKPVEDWRSNFCVRINGLYREYVNICDKFGLQVDRTLSGNLNYYGFRFNYINGSESTWSGKYFDSIYEFESCLKHNNPHVYSQTDKPKVNWRFKTEAEFKAEGLWDDEGYPKYWNKEGNMNKYLGSPIPEEFHRYCEQKHLFQIDDGSNNWCFDSKDYTNLPLMPNSMAYDPSKAIDTSSDDIVYKKAHQTKSWLGVEKHSFPLHRYQITLGEKSFVDTLRGVKPFYLDELISSYPDKSNQLQPKEVCSKQQIHPDVLPMKSI